MAADPPRFLSELIPSSRYNYTGNESDSGVLYYANGVPVTYYHFVLNLAIILIHIGIIWLNAAMIQAIRKSRKIREPTGHCLIILSLSYIWLAFNMIYIACYGLFNMQHIKECLIRFGLNHSAYYMVSWSNLLLTIDRILHIELPFHYKSRVKIRYVWISTFFVTVAGIAYCESPVLFGWYNLPNVDNQVCKYFSNIPARYLQILLLITFITFPAVVIMYGRLVYIAISQRKKMKETLKGNKKKGIKWRPVKVVSLIAGVFLVGWGAPALFILYITFKSPYPPIGAYNTTLSSLLLFPSISAIVNPCFYTLHTEIKGLFKKTCCCGCSFRESNDSSSSSYSKKSSSRETILQKQLVTSEETSVQQATQQSNTSMNKSQTHIVDINDISDIAASNKNIDSGISISCCEVKNSVLDQSLEASLSGTVSKCGTDSNDDIYFIQVVVERLVVELPS